MLDYREGTMTTREREDLLAQIQERKTELDRIVGDDLKKATEGLADQYERALKELAKR